jgi:hypothetical protein
VGGAVKTPIHRVRSIQVGPVRVESGSVISMDFSYIGGPPGGSIAGVLGMDILGRAILDVEMASGRVALRDPASFVLPEGKWQRMLQFEGKPVVTIRFEDHAADINLDTGAMGALTLGFPVVDRLSLLRGRSLRRTNVRGVGGSAAGRAGTIEWVELGGRRIEAVPAFFADKAGGGMNHSYPDGIAGATLLDDFRVVIDSERSRIAFLPIR